VTDAFGASEPIVSTRLPLPELPFEPLQVTLVKLAGGVSLTATLVAVEGPLLLTTIVYVSGVPGTAVVLPSVLVTATSFWGVNVSVSLPLLLAGLVSLAAVAVALLVRLPVAAGSMIPVSV